MRIEQPNGFEFAEAEIGRGWSKTEGPISFELADTYGQFAAHPSLPERHGALRAMAAAALEALFRRDDVVVLAALSALTLLCWLRSWPAPAPAWIPAAMSGWLTARRATAGAGSAWTAAYWLIAFFMWTVMMVAMMLPSASPMVLLYARVVRQAERQGGAFERRGLDRRFRLGLSHLVDSFQRLGRARSVGA